MSEIIASGVIRAGRLEQWAETFASNPPALETPLVEELRVHFNDEGFYAIAVDPANVCMVGPATLDRGAFEAYESPGSVTIGISLTRLLELLNPADSDTLVNWSVDMETRKLNIEYANSDLEMAMIDPDAIRDEPDEPGTEVANEVVLEARDFQHALDMSDLMADHCRIIADPDERQVSIRAEGDTDKSTVSFSDEDVIDADVSEPGESIFSLDYLQAVAKPMPDDAEVRIQFGDEMPAQFNWDACEGHFSVQQWLAPRIQSN